MRHDIANHLDTMQALLENSRSGEAAAYLSELKAGAYDSTLGICENPIIDAFLHNKIESAGAAGVEIRARVSLSAGLPVSNVDLVRAFGNLLDNAIELFRMLCTITDIELVLDSRDVLKRRNAGRFGNACAGQRKNERLWRFHIVFLLTCFYQQTDQSLEFFGSITKLVGLNSFEE